LSSCCVMEALARSAAVSPPAVNKVAATIVAMRMIVIPARCGFICLDGSKTGQRNKTSPPFLGFIFAVWRGRIMLVRPAGHAPTKQHSSRRLATQGPGEITISSLPLRVTTTRAPTPIKSTSVSGSDARNTPLTVRRASLRLLVCSCTLTGTSARPSDRQSIWTDCQEPACFGVANSQPTAGPRSHRSERGVNEAH
jgi:hypothetical protein